MRAFSFRCSKPNGSTLQQCEVQAVGTIFEENWNEEDAFALRNLMGGAINRCTGSIGM